MINLGPKGGLMYLLIAFDVALRGLALWQVARKGRKVWFVVLLLLNTLGILPLIYLFGVEKGEMFRGMKSESNTKRSVSRKKVSSKRKK